MTHWMKAAVLGLGFSFLSLAPGFAASGTSSSGITLTSTNPFARTGKVRLDAKYKRQIVEFASSEKAGTIIVNTGQKFLYLVLGGGKAIRYGIGTAKDGFEWSATLKVSRKAEWPGWTPPAAMKKRRPDLPDYMPGGLDNPLGARALYLGSTLYRIHGTSEPWTIGTDVSSGCIRLVNDDVIDLYERVKIGAKVIVL